MMDEHEKFRVMTSIYNALAIAYNGARQTKCPHCQSEREIPILPLAPILICQCEQCKQYVVPFVGELLPLPSAAIRDGTEADKRWAAEQAIMKFLHEAVRELFKYKIESEIPKDF